MSRLLLSIHCGAHDAESIAACLRDLLHAPVHQRRESVFGRDFDDAATGERVSGSLTRAALEVELSASQVQDAVEAVRNVRRRLPFRWRTTAIIAAGRVE